MFSQAETRRLGDSKKLFEPSLIEADDDLTVNDCHRRRGIAQPHQVRTLKKSCFFLDRGNYSGGGTTQ